MAKTPIRKSKTEANPTSIPKPSPLVATIPRPPTTKKTTTPKEKLARRARPPQSLTNIFFGKGKKGKGTGGKGSSQAEKTPINKTKTTITTSKPQPQPPAHPSDVLTNEVHEAQGSSPQGESGEQKASEEDKEAESTKENPEFFLFYNLPQNHETKQSQPAQNTRSSLAKTPDPTTTSKRKPF